MARSGEGLDDPTDLNNDCITNIEDFAEMASVWLNDYSSLGQTDK